MFKVKMEYKQLVKEVENYVKKICKGNFKHTEAFTNHTEKVRDFAIKLADIYKADKEVVEIAALLHDIYYIEHPDKHDEHEIFGVERAKEILNGKMPKEKIELIIKCIKHHRGAKNYKRESIEEQIIACADAMVHINSVLIWVYIWGIERADFEERKKILKEKIERSWKKINLPKARKIVEKKYKAIMTLLEED